MTTLYAVSQSMNGRVSNNCNLSENYIRWETKYGDSCGDFAPVAHLTSDEVVAVGDYLGLPYDLTHKGPIDGLTVNLKTKEYKTDEENFGFTYEVLNKYIREGICDDEEIKNKIDDMNKRGKAKMRENGSI